MHRYLREIGADCLDLTVSAFRLIREKRGLFLVFALALAAVAVSTFPHDVNVYHWLTDQRSDPVRWVARRVSKWGDYPTGTLILAAGLWVAGFVFKRRTWRTDGLACLLAATIAGIAINPVRALAGRPRPSMEVKDRFTGPKFAKEFHSFPSAHSTTSFGTATALAVAAPAIGIPALVAAAAVGWSRMYVREHYLTDVIVGAGFGAFFGLAFGLAAQRREIPTKHADF
jgi:membrane-associated phospholipid phosphatase